MKYLIWATNTDMYRTKTSWIKDEKQLFEGEKMLSFDSRKEADQLINKGFKNCQSYAIPPTHPLYKHC